MTHKEAHKRELNIPLVHTSAPCRIDLGGTLDLSTFFYPLMHSSPCTFNMAIGLRTEVRIFKFKKGRIKISSKGFGSVEFASSNLPFDHPMGLMLAIAQYFHADGIHISIESASPPQSALGGSSVAAVALIAALSEYFGPSPLFPHSKREMALLARDLEALSAQTPCGIQDHLAAAYGGVNVWYWQPGMGRTEFTRKTVVPKKQGKILAKHLLLAYCGEPHVSISVNNQWVKQFMAGNFRKEWVRIINLTKDFVRALSAMNIKDACAAMNAETRIRLALTPDVLDDAGKKLFAAAKQAHCGARFAGAGGGGCVWALGEEKNISKLKHRWAEILAEYENGRMLDATLDFDGLLYH